MNKLNRIYFFVSLGLILFGAVLFVAAQSPEIEFPIAELGGCESKETCRAYCDDLTHKTECIAFARKHGLIDEAGAAHAEKLPEVGPGGCRSEESCRAYCEDPSHTVECVNFAADHGFMDREEAERVLRDFNKTGPGGCRGHEECNTYCSQPENSRGCLEFARREGHVTEDQYQKTTQLLEKAERGGPGGCRGENDCRVYCDDHAHIDECLSFAEKEGFIAPDEAKRLRKVGLATGPGGCKGQECRTYCEDVSHQAECIEFAAEHGLMSPKEAEMARKFAGKEGPGGCKGPRECETFCSNPANAEMCLEHAAEAGLMPPQEVERARKFLRVSHSGGPGGCRGMECRNYCEDPAHREECFNFVRKNDLIPPEEIRRMESGLKIQKKMEESGGPGGCKSDQECMRYCSEPSHVEECVAFGATHGGIPPEEVRRMLKEFTEGRVGPGDFGPPEDFHRFEQDSFHRFEEFRQLEEQFRGGPGFGPPGSPGFGPPGGFPGSPGGLPAGQAGFPDGSGPSRGFGGQSGETRIRAEKNQSSGFDILILDSDGIERFSITPKEGQIYGTTVYGGQVSGCAREFKVERLGLSHSSFPLSVTVVDCKGSEKTIQVTPRGFEQPGQGITPLPVPFPAPLPISLPGSGPRTGQSPRTGPGGGFGGLCPALPTVNECPPGQRKEAVHSSQECGTYYACIPETGSGFPLPMPVPFPEPLPLPGLDPEKDCAAKGGQWDAGAHFCRFGGEGTIQPTESPAVECGKRGGVWIDDKVSGSYCHIEAGIGPLERVFANLMEGILNFFR